MTQLSFLREKKMYRRQSNGYLFAGIVFVLCVLAFGACETVVAVKFSINVTDRLKRAADANTVGTAIKELDSVISYLEQNNVTEGYTSVIYETPDEDVGFWYNNLKSSLVELRSLPESSTTLEKSNALMKLRETILDSGKSSDKVTEPDGISRFPSNLAWALGNCLLIPILAIFAFLCLFKWWDD